MDPEANNCKNCGQVTNAKYCPNCGQRSSVEKVTLKETFEDLADNLFSLSAPLVITLKYLVIDPGRLLREYLAGKRKSYYKPISFFLLTTLVYIFLRWLIGFNTINQAGNPADNPLIDADLLEQAGNFMFQNINNLLFIFVLALALAMKIFFYRRYTLIEYLAVAFYLIGFYSLLASINIFYIQYVDKELQFFAILIMWAYFVYAMLSFLEGRRLITGIKAAFLFIFAFVLYVFLAFNLSYMIILMKQI